MNTARYFKLGLFVIAGVGMILGTILALGAGRLLQKSILAETVMDESVDGLDIGAPVKYRGVTIGSVTSIAFTADRNGAAAPVTDRIARYVLIDMALNEKTFRGMSHSEVDDTLKMMTKIGLRARLDMQGIGGGVYVGLDFVEPPPTAPPQPPANSRILFIPSAPSTMAQVMSTADRLASDIRQADLPQVIQHFDGLIANASRTAQHVNQIVQTNEAGINSAVGDLPAITKDMKATSARLDQLLHDSRVNATIGNVTNDTADAGATIQDVHGTVRNLQSIILSQQEDIQQIIADLRRTADNLAAVSTDIRDDPARLIFSQPPPRKTPGQ
ncbi:MAG TPA: MlaD family protein [Tepidisphaeraceae bacterium]|jgi:paraquat-inducible protein B|nr:MlaD family protein [Tepidisphaeraceae bacterium]